MNYSPDHWLVLSGGYSRMTQWDGSTTSVGNGSYNGLFKLPGGKPLGTQWKTVGGTVSVRVTGNKGRKRGGGYLRIPSFSSSLFRASFVERTSGEGVFLESPAVGLLGLRNFKLPAVGLPGLRNNWPRRSREECCGG